MKTETTLQQRLQQSIRVFGITPKTQEQIRQTIKDIVSKKEMK